MFGLCQNQIPELKLTMELEVPCIEFTHNCPTMGASKVQIPIRTDRLEDAKIYAKRHHYRIISVPISQLSKSVGAFVAELVGYSDEIWDLMRNPPKLTKKSDAWDWNPDVMRREKAILNGEFDGGENNE